MRCTEEMSSYKRLRGIPVIELVADWVLPIVGGCFTLVLLNRAGVRSFWAFLLILPGALVFQWAVLLALMGLGSMFRRRRPDVVGKSKK